MPLSQILGQKIIEWKKIVSGQKIRFNMYQKHSQLNICLCSFESPGLVHVEFGDRLKSEGSCVLVEIWVCVCVMM